MALVKTDNTIVSIRGRLGGVYFKKDRSGLVCRAMPRHVLYARGESQMMGVRGFSSGAWLWALALLGFFSAVWAVYALAHLFTTRTGEQKHITGYNWFIYYHFLLAGADGTSFWKPPHGPDDLPDHVITYQGMYTYENTPNDWPPDIPSDYYWEGIPNEGKPSYKNDNNNWFIWWTGDKWAVSRDLGFATPGKTFFRSDIENHGQINGYYKNPTTGKFCHVYVGKPAE